MLIVLSSIQANNIISASFIYVNNYNSINETVYIGLGKWEEIRFVTCLIFPRFVYYD